MDEPKLAHTLASAAEAIGARDDEEQTGQRICELAVQLIEGCHHASITRRRRRDRLSTLAAGSELADELDHQQYAWREGPCVTVAVTGIDRLVSSDLARDDRWPRWGPFAAERGVRSAVAVPLIRGRQSLGALNLYGHHLGPWSATDLEAVGLYATHATTLLSASHHIDGLTSALSGRHRIGLAQGILMSRHQVSAEQAFKAMVRRASHENIKLSVVVDEIITSEDPEFTDPPPG